jgi:hypothetical protein
VIALLITLAKTHGKGGGSMKIDKSEFVAQLEKTPLPNFKQKEK